MNFIREIFFSNAVWFSYFICLLFKLCFFLEGYLKFVEWESCISNSYKWLIVWSRGKFRTRVYYFIWVICDWQIELVADFLDFLLYFVKFHELEEDRLVLADSLVA